MASLIERSNQVAMTNTVTLETINMNKEYNLLMVSLEDDRRESRFV